MLGSAPHAIGAAVVAAPAGQGVAAVWSARTGAWDAWPSESDELEALWRASATYTTWLHITSAVLALFGTQLFAYAYFHEGLRVYMLLLREAFLGIKDFVVLFVYLLTALTLAMSTYFNCTGGSPDLAKSVTWSQQTLLLLTFGYYDYDRFVNRGFGSGDYRALVIFFFWAIVTSLVVVSHNVIIATFVNAYEEVRLAGESLSGTMSFPVMLGRRLRFHWRLSVSLGPAALGEALAEVVDDRLGDRASFQINPNRRRRARDE